MPRPASAAARPGRRGSIDSTLAEAMATENRFRMLSFSQPERARALARQAELEVARRWAIYQALAGTQAKSLMEAPA